MAGVRGSANGVVTLAAMTNKTIFALRGLGGGITSLLKSLEITLSADSILLVGKPLQWEINLYPISGTATSLPLSHVDNSTSSLPAQALINYTIEPNAGGTNLYKGFLNAQLNIKPFSLRFPIVAGEPNPLLGVKISNPNSFSVDIAFTLLFDF